MINPMDMNTNEIGDVIPVMIFGQAHIIEIVETSDGKHMETWDGRPILYPELALESKFEALVRAVAKIAELHSVKENHWRTVGV